MAYSNFVDIEFVKFAAIPGSHPVRVWNSLPNRCPSFLENHFAVAVVVVVVVVLVVFLFFWFPQCLQPSCAQLIDVSDTPAVNPKSVNKTSICFSLKHRLGLGRCSWVECSSPPICRSRP